MKTLLLFGLFVLTFLGSVALQAEERIQEKVKTKGDRTTVQDKSKPVRHALEKQYAKIAEAQKNRDIEALRRLRTPDFTVKMPNGDTWNLEQSLDYSRRAFEQVQSIIKQTNTIESLDVHGSEATAIIHQEWSRMQMMKGKLRRVDTSAVQRETWVNTPDGWKLKLIDEIKPGSWYVDGKRVDPGKPYDPDAPPYDPDKAAPSK